MVRVCADTEMKTFLATRLDEVLIGAYTGGLESLGAQLLILVGDEVDTEGKVIDTGTLATQVEDADLGVGNTAVESRLGIRLPRKKSRVSKPYCNAISKFPSSKNIS